MKRKAKKAKAVCLPKPWTIGTLIVVEPYRVDGELPFFEQQIERWRLPADAKRIFGFELCDRDTEKYQQRIRELLALDEVVLLQIERIPR